MKEKLKNYRANVLKNVHKKLIFRQRLFLLVILVLLVICVMNVFNGKIDSFLSLAGFAGGTGIGLSLNRMFKIFGHSEQEKIISRFDALGVTLLIVYIAIDVGRNWIFGHWLSGVTLTSFGLIFLTGLLLGRFLGTFMKINKILLERGKAG